MPDPRMLYMASPLRLEKLEERNLSDVESSKVFAAAFPEAMENSSESSNMSEDEEDNSLPTKSNSLQTDDIKKFIHARSNSDEKSPEFKKIIPTIVINEEFEKDSPPPEIKPKARRGSHDIYNDLDNRIKASLQNIADLCLAEKSTYSHSGSTNFLALDIPKKAASLTSLHFPQEIDPNSSSNDEKNKPIRKSFRPAPIEVKVVHKPDVSKEYNYYLANNPEH